MSSEAIAPSSLTLGLLMTLSSSCLSLPFDPDHSNYQTGLILRVHRLFGECAEITGQLVDGLVTDSEDTHPAAPPTSPISPQFQPTIPPVMTMRTVHEIASKIAAADFNPNGPLSLFVPGELTLDGRVQSMYNNFLYDLPAPGSTGQLYLITHGRRVGIFALWSRAAPHISGVKHGVCIKVASIEEAEEVLHECIDNGTARWVQH